MKQSFFVLIALVAASIWSSLGKAQSVREHSATSLKSFHGIAQPIRRSFASDAEAQAVLKQILLASGLGGMEDRITLRASAETNAAEAFIQEQERLIVYNVVFMHDLAKKSDGYWSKVAVLAHELGHHIRWHTQISGNEHKFELEADYQAGFILRRMGANLDEALALFRTLPVEATTSHPGRDQRVQMAALGWTDAGGQTPSPKAEAPSSDLASLRAIGKEFAIGSRAGNEVTVVEAYGIDSEKAMAVGLQLSSNIVDLCQNARQFDRGTMAFKNCISSEQSVEKPDRFVVRANCKTGTVFLHEQQAPYTLPNRSRLKTSDCSSPGFWEEAGNPERLGWQATVVLSSTFKVLCPTNAARWNLLRNGC